MSGLVAEELRDAPLFCRAHFNTGSVLTPAQTPHRQLSPTRRRHRARWPTVDPMPLLSASALEPRAYSSLTCTCLLEPVGLFVTTRLVRLHNRLRLAPTCDRLHHECVGIVVPPHDAKAMH